MRNAILAELNGYIKQRPGLTRESLLSDVENLADKLCITIERNLRDVMRDVADRIRSPDRANGETHSLVPIDHPI